LSRRGDKHVTVIIDLTPIRDGTGPARLLDMAGGRSKQVFKVWLGERDTSWRDGIEMVAMDGFTGFKTATSEELPGAVAVMDSFHVVRLAGDALDQCRRRVQQPTCGHRGRKGDPLYAARRALHTGSGLLTGTQRQRLTALFVGDEDVEVEATWGICQHMIAAYREPDRKRGRELMQQLIGAISHSVPTTCARWSPSAGPSDGEPPRAGLPRPARHFQRAGRGDQRPSRTPPRLSPRLPQPRQLHRQIASGDRRVRAPATPSIMKCLITSPARLVVSTRTRAVQLLIGSQQRRRRALTDCQDR
jgi:transposase